MILIDALHINNGGGLSLLRVLVNAIEDSNREAFYLFDKRAEAHFTHVPAERKFISPPGLINRFKFYSKYSRRFDTIFCFANLPPLSRKRQKTITYFQNVLILAGARSGSIKSRIGWLIRRTFLAVTRNNTDIWYVQTENTRFLFEKEFPDQAKRIILRPFWDEFFNGVAVNGGSRKNFLYVSDGHPHKNHTLLLKAWEKLFDMGYNIPLTLTVNSNYSLLCTDIANLRKKGLEITNTGIVTKERVRELYATHEVTIYPSLEESFGLGIIEAVSAGQNIIASDLDYVKSIVKPSVLFDPANSDAIANAVLFYYNTHEIARSELLIKNSLPELINELK